MTRILAIDAERLGWSETRSSHAEYTAVPINQLIPKPAELSWQVAGSLYVIACTAYAAVRAVAVQPGDTIHSTPPPMYQPLLRVRASSVLRKGKATVVWLLKCTPALA